MYSTMYSHYNASLEKGQMGSYILSTIYIFFSQRTVYPVSTLFSSVFIIMHSTRWLGYQLNIILGEEKKRVFEVKLSV